MSVRQRILRQRIVIGVSLFVVVGALAAYLLADRSTRLDKAIEKMDDDAAFSTSARAGQSVADISTELRLDGARCRDDDGPKALCDALLSAAAFTAVTAVAMLDCTAPDVFDARTATRAYLRSLRTFVEEGARDAAPSIPKVVTC